MTDDHDDFGQRMSDLLCGDQANKQAFGPYFLLRCIGRGGMGDVHVAYEPKLDRNVAIKIIRRGLSGEAEADKALRAEAKALAKLSHPNVVPIHEVGSYDGQTFIVMEYIKGQTLRNWCHQERRRSDIIRAYRELAQGIGAVHDAGLVHGDIKPENALMGDDGRVRLIDFGLVHRASAGRLHTAMPGYRESHGAHQPLNTRLCEGGAGTRAYMAPEVRAGGVSDERSDQFSFCVSWFEALYGKLPFADRSEYFARTRPLEPDVRGPGHVHRALLKGLSQDPDARFVSMGSLVQSLSPRTRLLPAVAIAGTATFVLALNMLQVKGPIGPTDEQCRGRSACTQRGECFGAHQECVAGSELDCQSSTGCTRRGLCALSEERCVAAQDEDCRNAQACKQEGHCTAQDGRCTAFDDLDCRNANICRFGRACAANDGHCEEAFECADECRDAGRCIVALEDTKYYSAGKCVAMNDEHCRKSEACKLSGSCSASIDGLCRPSSAVDCLHSDDCTYRGRCHYRTGACTSSRSNRG